MEITFQLRSGSRAKADPSGPPVTQTLHSASRGSAD